MLRLPGGAQAALGSNARLPLLPPTLQRRLSLPSRPRPLPQRPLDSHLPSGSHLYHHPLEHVPERSTSWFFCRLTELDLMYGTFARSFVLEACMKSLDLENAEIFFFLCFSIFEQQILIFLFCCLVILYYA